MKGLLKFLSHCLAALLVSPVTLVYFVFSLVFSKDSTLASFSQILCLLPGKVGSYLRVGFYRFAFQTCSSDVVISFATLFSQQDTSISKGVYIGPQCNIGRCKIGENVLLGSGVNIMSGKSQHNFESLDVPIKDQGGRFDKVIIGDNCWIGNCALIMANIGASTIVAAGSVVINDMPANSVVAGNPAKVIKTRQ